MFFRIPPGDSYQPERIRVSFVLPQEILTNLREYEFRSCPPGDSYQPERIRIWFVFPRKFFGKPETANGLSVV